MPLTKREKRTVVVLVCIAAVVTAMYGGIQLTHYLALQAYEQACKEAQIRVREGETLRLNSDEDKATEIMGESYQAGFDWNGTMNFTINETWLYSSWDKLAKSLNYPTWLDRPSDYDQTEYLVAHITITNVDAEPVRVDNHGVMSFSMGLIQLHPSGELIGFDGCIYGAQEQKDAFAYKVEKGMTESYLLVFSSSSPSHLSIGVSWTNEKYIVNISPSPVDDSCGDNLVQAGGQP